MRANGPPRGSFAAAAVAASATSRLSASRRSRRFGVSSGFLEHVVDILDLFTGERVDVHGVRSPVDR